MELVYFSSVLVKVDQGGWAPLVIPIVSLIVMYVWHYGTVKRYEFELYSKVSMAWIQRLGSGLGLVRVPGVGLVYIELKNGVPHKFSHFMTHFPAVHSVVVCVCMKYLPVSTVHQEERFLVRRIGTKDFHIFRCVAIYGYKVLHKKDDNFEKMLFDALTLLIRNELLMDNVSNSDDYSMYERPEIVTSVPMENENGETNAAAKSVRLFAHQLDLQGCFLVLCILCCRDSTYRKGTADNGSVRDTTVQ